MTTFQSQPSMIPNLKIISNRGNLYGPATKEKDENNITCAFRAVSRNYGVMLNICFEGDTLWFGCDYPQNEIYKPLLSKLNKYPNILFCSNQIDAIQKCKSNGLECFINQTVSFTYPNGRIVISHEEISSIIMDSFNKHNTIILEPEKNPNCWKVLLNQQDIHEGILQSVITNYPILLEFAFKFGLLMQHSDFDNHDIDVNKNHKNKWKRTRGCGDDDHVEQKENNHLPNNNNQEILLTNHKIFEQGLVLDFVYDEIAKRSNPNYDDLPKDFKELSNQFCISAFSDLIPNNQLLTVSKIAQRYFDKDDVVFTTLENRKKYQGVLHFTHFQFVSFRLCQELKAKEFKTSKSQSTSSTQPQAPSSNDILELFRNYITSHQHENSNLFDFNQIHESTKDTDIKQRPHIIFHRILKVPCGLILVGYPNFKILNWRKTMSDHIDSNKSLDIHEYYTKPAFMNTVHCTLVRFLQRPSMHYVDDCVKVIQSKLPITVELGPRQIEFCNYTMDESIKRSVL